ncbi:MAG: hypothetical protein KAV83_05925 [Desulfobacterales bacterium]|nr:hypothetical protein [Desulfobacterales bacterium]
MKAQRIVIVLIVLFLIGITIVSHTLMRYEKKHATQDLLNKGTYLVNLIALHPVSDFEGHERDFLVKTLYENISSEGLVYCLILDRTGHPLIALDPYNLVSRIPRDIHLKSRYATGLTKQTVEVTGSDETIYEFAKPVFKSGQRTGTVRLGFRPAALRFFSLERIGLLATIAFFIFAMVPFIYCGIRLALRPLKNIDEKIKNIGGGTAPCPATASKEPDIDDVIQSLDQSLSLLREKYKKLEVANMQFEAKIGLIGYEKKQINNIMDSVHYGIIITDSHDNVNHVNRYMLNLLNNTRRQVMARPLSKVLDHEEILSFISQQEVVGQNAIPNHIETTFPELAPGENFQVSSSYLTDGEKTIIGKVISIKNITNEKSAERAKHEFISQVAHELRAPLTTIKSYNEMLMGGEIDDIETQKEFYNTITEETDRLARLIENLLNISKIEMGSLSLNRGLLKTDWLVDDCIAAIKAPAQKKHIIIERNMPDKFPSLVGDKELLKVALINILGNAVKYTPENGTITFALTEQDNTIIFDVIDTGYSISKEDLPHVFEKFYRSADANVNKQTGSGLGLPIAFEIIGLHGGKIEVQSKPGKGARFTIRIPKGEYYLGKQ